MEEEQPIILSDIVSLKGFKYAYLEKFLKENGYNWNYYLDDILYGTYSFSSSHRFYIHKPKYEHISAHNYLIIWLGDSYEEKFSPTADNQFIRCIHFEIDKFQIFTYHKILEYKYHLKKVLEKDLTKEWIQFLAREKEYYRKGLIKLCTQRRIGLLDNLEKTKQHVKTEKARLDKELEDYINTTDKEVDFLDSMSKWLEEI